MIGIDFVIGYSTVKIDRVSDQYLFYYNLRGIEQRILHILLFTCSSPRRPLFMHALSFERTTKLCINFLNQFPFYSHV